MRKTRRRASTRGMAGRDAASLVFVRYTLLAIVAVFLASGLVLGNLDALSGLSSTSSCMIIPLQACCGPTQLFFLACNHVHTCTLVQLVCLGKSWHARLQYDYNRCSRLQSSSSSTFFFRLLSSAGRSDGSSSEFLPASSKESSSNSKSSSSTSSSSS